MGFRYYFLNTYKTRHMMECQKFNLLRDAREAAKDLKNWAIVRQLYSGKWSEGENKIVDGDEQGKFWAKECNKNL